MYRVSTNKERYLSKASLISFETIVHTIRRIMAPGTDGLLPKDYTRVSDLINRTGCNGQGITVAVLDTGVDPGAAGLEKTPDGRKKVIDILDCTGSGDVDMSTVKKPSADHTVVGLTGRVLNLGLKICKMNPSKEFHVGAKLAYELLPKSLVTRIKAERRKAWKKAQLESMREVCASLTEINHDDNAQKAKKKLTIEELEAQKYVLSSFEKSYKDVGPVYDCITFHDGNGWRAAVDTEGSGDFSSCAILEDYRVNCKHASIGKGNLMNYGVNIYEEGNLLSIVVDSGSHGTHVAGIIGAYYQNTPEMNGLAPGVQIVSLKIGDTRLGGMETHRGLMRAMGYLLENSRYGSDDVPADRRIRIDVANMSFGEPTYDPNHGRFVEAMKKLVYKHNVMFIASAGNNGPALSSVSAPGGTTAPVIGVGAYVSADMLTQAYSALKSDVSKNKTVTSYATCHAPSPVKNENYSRVADKIKKLSEAAKNETFSVEEIASESVEAIPYTWSSRGPVSDGAIGVSICAPGGAISPVPRWCLQKKELMNGTSMASPSAAGAIAVIISFLKTRSILYSSSMLRRVIEFTAKPLGLSSFGGHEKLEKQGYYKDLVFSGGAGSIDALSTCKYIESSSPFLTKDLHKNIQYDTLLTSVQYWSFDVKVSELSGGKNVSKPSAGVLNTSRGVYLRGSFETDMSHRFEISVEPSSPDDEHKLSKEARANMEITLSIESSSSWVQVPSSMILMGAKRVFPIIVDPTNLESGKVHFAQIFGYLKRGSKSGNKTPPLFKVPITVVKPEFIKTGTYATPISKLSFSGGAVFRRFYQVPYGATFARLRITTDSNFSNPIKSTKILNHEESSKNFAIVSASEQRSNDNEISSPSSDSRFFEVHLMQVAPLKTYRETESRHYATIHPNSIREMYSKVCGGKVIELCLAQMWSSPGATVIEKVELEFCGLKIDPPILTCAPMASCFERVEISNQLPAASSSSDLIRSQQILQPKGSLSTIKRTILPLKSSFKILGNRDKLSEYGNITQMKLEYAFEVYEHSSSIKIRFPELNRSVYESEVDGGPFVIVTDANGQLVHKSDIYPGRIDLSKGIYFIDAHINHTDVQILDQLKELRAHVSYLLSSKIALDAYDSRHGATLGMKSRKLLSRPRNIQNGEGVALFFSAPEKSKIPKWAVNGDILTGELVIDSLSGPNTSKVKSHPKYPIYYPIHTSNPSSRKLSRRNFSRSEKKNNDSTKQEDNTGNEESNIESTSLNEKWLEEEILKVKLAKMKTLLSEMNMKEFDTISESLRKEYPDNLELKLLNLERYEREVLSSDSQNAESMPNVRKISNNAESCADDIISSINVAEVAAKLYLNRNKDSGNSEEHKKNEDLEIRIVTTLFRKARVLEHMCMLEENIKKNAALGSADSAKMKESCISAFEKAYDQLREWVNLDGKSRKILSANTKEASIVGADIILLAAKREKMRKRFGSSLKILDNHFSSPSHKQQITENVSNLRVEMLRELNWSHAEKQENEKRSVIFPPYWSGY